LVAVASRRAAREHAVLVDEGDRRAVDLRLDHIADAVGAAEPLAHVLGPLVERLVRRHLLERAHGREVLGLLEPIARRRADTLRRRIGCDELRMLALELDELVVDAVVLRVANRRVVEDVVLVRPLRQLVAQLLDATLGNVPNGAHSQLLRA
jgi:hypothetical protein